MTSHTLLFLALFFLGTVICTLKAQISCGGSYNYTTNNGFLLSPNYPNVYNNNCQYTYTISLTTISSILLTFETFELDRNTSTGDNVTISCVSNSSYIQKTYYWNSVAIPISIPWCSTAQLYFQSDSSNSDSVKGFRIQYQVSTIGCGNTVYTNTSGNITSPNYPQLYSNNENCTYLIWTSQPSSFNLTFQSLDLESFYSTCPWDWVQIWCDDASNMQPKEYCGSTLPMPFNISNCNQVLIWFHSDEIYAYSGFSLQYFVTPNELPIMTTKLSISTATSQPTTKIPTTTMSTTKTSTTTKPTTKTSTTTKPTTKTSTTTKPTTKTSTTTKPTTKTSTTTKPNTNTSTTTKPTTKTATTTKPTTKTSTTTKPTTKTSTTTKPTTKTSTTTKLTTITSTTAKPTTKTSTTPTTIRNASATKTSTTLTTSKSVSTTSKPLSVHTTTEPVAATMTKLSFSTSTTMPTTNTSTTSTTTTSASTFMMSTGIKTSKEAVTTIKTTASYYEKWKIPFIVVATCLASCILVIMVLGAFYMNRRFRRRSSTDAARLDYTRTTNDYSATNAVPGISSENIAMQNQPYGNATCP